MPTSAVPPARPRRPLANLRGAINPAKRPPPRPGGRRPTPSSGAPGSAAASNARRCPQCDSTDVQEDDGFIVCQSCFTQIGEANIVADVTFEEQAGGRSTVQGGFVSDNARHAKTLGAGAYRKVGGGERNSLAEIESTGRRALGALTPKLGIADTVAQQANQIWTLAANINFSAGRKTDEVVAACLYAACRRQTQNEVLLMDIAELLHINVFRLGEVYKDLCRELYLANESVGVQHLVELEPLIWKYCRKLQFEDKTKDVATDALKIMKRMTRDWIVAGRHPAGLCGACIILAARMNNFRRSVREVVYVSKVADVTIAKRVEEFRRTKSAALTVDQFREFGNRLAHQHDPPSFESGNYRDQMMEKRKQKRREHMLRLSTTPGSSNASNRPSTAIDIPDDATDISSRDSSVAPTSSESEVNRTGQSVEESPAQEASHDRASTLTPPSTDPTNTIENSENINPTSNSAISLPTPPATQLSQPSNTQTGAPTGGPSSTLRANSRKRRSNNDEVDLPNSSTTNTPQVLSAPAARNKRQKVSKSPGTAEASAPPTKGPRYDADGFAIPALPIDPALVKLGANVNANGRRKKNEPPPVIDLSEEELLEEEYLEQEIESALGDDEVIDSRNEVEKAKDEERAHFLALQQQQLDAQATQARREADGVIFGDAPAWNPGDKLDENDLAKEFENDPEVQRCQLSPEEVQVKERIWVAHNEDWLRKQAEKEMMQHVARTTHTQTRAGRRGKKGEAGRKRRGKMGDGSVLTDHSTPIETPADAAKAMLEKRAPLKSMHVDFSALERIYGRQARSQSSESVTGSAAPSREQTPASTTAGDDEDEQEAPNRDDADGNAEGDVENEDDADGAADDADDGDADDADGIATDGRIQVPTWDDIDDDHPNEDDEDAEDDYRRAIGVGTTEEDEFGAVDGGFGGDDYDEYE